MQSNHAKTSQTSPAAEVVLDQRMDGSIRAFIATERLIVAPVSHADAADYHQHLFGDQNVMRKFATGETRDRDYVDRRINTWVERWKSGDPFGGFAIRSKSGEFIGHVVLGHGDHPGHSEIAYLIRSDRWQQGYGSEAVRGVVQGLAPLLRVYGFKVEGAEFRVIDATASPDNHGSRAILSKVGMANIGSLGKFDTERLLYQGQVALPDPTRSWESLVFSDRIITRDLK